MVVESGDIFPEQGAMEWVAAYKERKKQWDGWELGGQEKDRTKEIKKLEKQKRGSFFLRIRETGKKERKRGALKD